MKIALLGDVGLFGRFSTRHNSRIRDLFSVARRMVSDCDYVVCNLETPFVLAERPWGAKSAHISANPVDVGLLQELGVHSVNLANNHVYDFGPDALKRTTALLDDSGISYFGIGGRQVILQDGVTEVALTGFCCYSTNPIGVRTFLRPGGVDPLHLKHLERTLVSDRRLGRFSVLSIHWGIEHVNFPSREHIELARYLTKLNPYVLYGHHPHVLQGVESLMGSLLAYSLGNFCFDDVYTPKSTAPLIRQSDNNRRSAILKIEIVGTELRSFRILPIISTPTFISFDDDGDDRLQDYTSRLRCPEPAYSRQRNALIHQYLTKRKRQRTLDWYLKRMNPSSVRMLAATAINSAHKYVALTYPLRCRLLHAERSWCCVDGLIPESRSSLSS